MSRVQASLLAVLLVVVVGAASGVAGGAAPATASVPPTQDASVVGTTATQGASGGGITGASVADTTPSQSASAVGAAGGTPPRVEGGPPGESLVEADSVSFRITVFANGSARWTVVYLRTLNNDTERQRFEAFAEDFNDNETAAYQNFKDQARGLAKNGRENTGRDMTATAFSKNASLGGSCTIPENCGTVRMSFIWSEFAYRDGEKRIVDDVFAGQGLFLGADRSIVFAAGPDLEFASTSPAPDSQSNPDSLADSDTVAWQGKKDFAPRRPRVVLLPPSSDSTVTPKGTPTSTAPGGGPGDGTTGTATSPPGQSGGGNTPMLLVGGLLVVLLGVGFAFAVRRGDDGSGAAPAESDTGSGPSAPGAGPTTPDGVSGEPAVPDEELLTDEDKVLNMLRDNGGRMKQVDIVDETGWSKSKVSMLLSDMEDEGDISKLRVGRENIVSLAGHEPEAAGSPHDDE